MPRRDLGELFEVEEVVGKRLGAQASKVEYMIKWKNYGPEFNTWEPLENLGSDLEIIQYFEVKREFERYNQAKLLLIFYTKPLIKMNQFLSSKGSESFYKTNNVVSQADACLAQEFQGRNEMHYKDRRKLEQDQKGLDKRQKEQDKVKYMLQEIMAKTEEHHYRERQKMQKFRYTQNSLINCLKPKISSINRYACNDLIRETSQPPQIIDSSPSRIIVSSSCYSDSKSLTYHVYKSMVEQKSSTLLIYNPCSENPMQQQYEQLSVDSSQGMSAKYIALLTYECFDMLVTHIALLKNHQLDKIQHLLDQEVHRRQEEHKRPCKSLHKSKLIGKELISSEIRRKDRPPKKRPYAGLSSVKYEAVEQYCKIYPSQAPKYFSQSQPVESPSKKLKAARVHKQKSKDLKPAVSVLTATRVSERRQYNQIKYLSISENGFSYLSRPGKVEELFSLEATLLEGRGIGTARAVFYNGELLYAVQYLNSEDAADEVKLCGSYIDKINPDWRRQYFYSFI